MHWSKGKTQAHSTGSILCFGIFTGILFAKLLLWSPWVSKNEQTVLLSLEKHLLWKQQYGGEKKKNKQINKTVIGGLIYSKLLYLIQWNLQMMKDVHPPSPGDPDSPESHYLIGRWLSQGTGGERAKAWSGDERPPLDSNLKGPAQVGVDLPWEVVQAQTPSKNGSLVKQHPGREAVQNKSRKRKMRNLALSFRSLNDTLEAAVG